MTDSAFHNSRILAKGVTVSDNTWETHLNNNDLIIGPSGSGKTRGYVIPNILQCNDSFIVTDTKGNLARWLGPVLAEHGYTVELLDLSAFSLEGTGDSSVQPIGYNPFDYIERDLETGYANDRQVMAMAKQLCPIEEYQDPFWDQIARMLIEILLTYVLNYLSKADRNMSTVAKLAGSMGDEAVAVLFDDQAARDPNSTFAAKWNMFKASSGADRMYASICGIVGEKLNDFVSNQAYKIYNAKKRLDFEWLSSRRAAVFITVSDTDRSADSMVNLLYSQALNQLCRIADSQDNSRLPVPVRLFLDDFATNCRIEEFDNIIAVIRSREIYVSVILQDLTQLESLYGTAASTIANNCDHWLYLGGQDTGTVQTFAIKVGKTPDTIMSLPLTKAYLFERGSRGRIVTPYDLSEHPLCPDFLKNAPTVKKNSDRA